MGKEKEELELDDLDLSMETQPIAIPKQYSERTIVKRKPATEVEKEELISCLKNEKIIIRFINRESGMITNPKHVFYGGMAEGATRVLTVPTLASTGAYINVLTNMEKAFLESAMGLEVNALSIYLKENNYWENLWVRLIKGDTYLDLSDPDDYIKYKVAIANRDIVAPSITEMQDRPKATYQFVIISENEETKESNKNLSTSMEAYMLLGKLQDQKEVLKLIVETIEGKPISSKAKLDFILQQVHKIVQSNPKMFVKVAKDPMLSTKVLIAESIECALIKKRGDYLYLANDNSPLCEIGEDPTLNIVASFLNKPKHQEIKFTLEAKLKSLKE